MNGQLYTRRNGGLATLTFPHEALAEHLFAYKPGWTATTEYSPSDERLPASLRKFCPEGGVHGIVVTPLVIGSRTLGWFKLATGSDASCEGARWWRTVLTEAIARQAALAIHFSQIDREQPRRRAAQGDPRGAQPAGPRHPRQSGPGLRRDPDAAAGGPARCRHGAGAVRAEDRDGDRPGSHAHGRGPAVGRRAAPERRRRRTDRHRPQAHQRSRAADDLGADRVRHGRTAAHRRRRRARDHRDRPGSADQRGAALAGAADHRARVDGALARHPPLGRRRRPRLRARSQLAAASA